MPARSLIDRIVLTPREEGGVNAVLHADLARILALCEAVRAALRVIGSGGGSGQAKTLEGGAIRGFCVCHGCADLKPPRIGA
jgi:hypothetical protein